MYFYFAFPIYTFDELLNSENILLTSQTAMTALHIITLQKMLYCYVYILMQSLEKKMHVGCHGNSKAAAMWYLIYT